MKNPPPTAPARPVETATAYVLKVIPHKGSDGKVVPEKWDLVAYEVEGTVKNKKVIESRVELFVARSQWNSELPKYMDKVAPTPEQLDALKEPK